MLSDYIPDSPALSTDSTAPPTKTKPLKSKKKKGPGHISRPPNAFLIFRSDFWAREKQKPKPVERDHRDISRIAAHCWQNLDPAAKQGYHNRAQQLRDLHRMQYPDYRFKPAPRRPRVPKGKSVTIIAAEERCRRIASSLIGTGLVQDPSNLRSSHPFEHTLQAIETTPAAPEPMHPTDYTYQLYPSDLNELQPFLTLQPYSLPPLPQFEVNLQWPQALSYYGAPDQQQFFPIPDSQYTYMYNAVH